jgi:hydroxymethylglutaryl-CoA lyase
MRFPSWLELREVGLRDGLQSRPLTVPTETKAEMFRGLVAAGFKKIEAVALVHPASMPHMADAEALLELVGNQPGVVVSGLALNRRGLTRALDLHQLGLLQEVHFLHATTNEVLRANGFKSDLQGNQQEVIAMATIAKEVGMRTMPFVSASFGCSIAGYVDPEIPLGIAHAFVDSGVIDEVCFSDSTGQGTPQQVFEFFTAVKDQFDIPITAHFHDSRGSGLANVLAALQVGLGSLTIDAAFAGLGGDVPFLPEAAGNICTEDLVSMLSGCGVETGIDLEATLGVARLGKTFFPDSVPSHVLQVGPVSWRRPLAQGV